MARAKVKAKFTRSAEEKHIGTEPVQGQVITNILPALNYYNYFYGLRDSYDFLLKFLDKDKKIKEKISRLSHNDIKTSTGWIAKMLSMNCQLPEEAMKFFKRELTSYVKKAEKKAKVYEGPTLVSTKDSPSITTISLIEEEVDRFFETFESAFDPASFLKINNASAATLKSVAEFYQPKLEELQSIKTDSELKQAYSFLSSAEIKKAIAFFQKIITAASQNAENKKRERKPRVKKAKSTAVLIKSVNLKQNDPETNISSLPAEKIIGASVLIFYNTKTKTITIYEGEKISVKGKTLENVTKALTKKLRKPKEQLQMFSKTTKRSYMKTFESLTTKASEPSNRINDDQILVYTT